MNPAAPALLLLADGRFPSGGHAQSWGVEAACALGDVTDVASLERFVHGRLATQGAVDAAVAAWLCGRLSQGVDVDWVEVDREVTARLASPRLRAASRAQGRQMMRAGQRVWPAPSLEWCRNSHAEGPHQCVALGAVAAAAQLAPEQAALCALHHLVGAATTAAVRLLGLDPFEVTALAARAAPHVGDAARRAAREWTTWTTPADLPATVGLMADVYAEHHATWEVRLFAS